MRKARGLLLFCALTLVMPLAAQEPTQKKVMVLPHVLEAVGKAIDQPAPAGLSSADQKLYADETAWLKTVRTRIEALIVEDAKAPREGSSGLSTGRRQHEPIRFSKEWGRLQATIEEESRRFNTLSNASRARHDIAMNAIRNLK